MSLSPALSDGIVCGHCKRVDCIGYVLNGTEGGVREVIIRNRCLLVDHWRKKRDGVKLAWQLKAKFAAIWPELRELLGIRFFVILFRGQLCA